ncbi:N-acetylmuramoyl-L-alanine amidase, partial [Hyphomonas adhaerens]
MNITLSPSPNFDERKHPIDMIVLHYTGMETGQAAFDQLRNPDAKVSAHYLLWEDGRVDQLVAEDRRAWHAGVSSWQGDDDLNSRSIGIEIVNGGHDFPA